MVTKLFVAALTLALTPGAATASTMIEYSHAAPAPPVTEPTTPPTSDPVTTSTPAVGAPGTAASSGQVRFGDDGALIITIGGIGLFTLAAGAAVLIALRPGSSQPPRIDR